MSRSAFDPGHDYPSLAAARGGVRQPRLLWDLSWGCARPHPERQTNAQVSRLFGQLREDLRAIGVSAPRILAELQAAAAAALVQASWLDGVGPDENGLPSCVWCRLDDGYVRIEKQLRQARKRRGS